MKTNTLKILEWVLLLGILLSGCGSGQFLAARLTPALTPTVTPTFTSTSTSTLKLTSTTTPTNTNTSTSTLTPTKTPVPKDTFPICAPKDWKNCEVLLTTDGLIDPLYFAWLNTIPVEFPQGTANKSLETASLGDSILDKGTTKFNLTAGHAKNKPNKFYYIEGLDEFIYPITVWSDSLQKPVWIVMVWSYLGKQSEGFLRGQYIPVLTKPERPNTLFAFQFNPRNDAYQDDIINAYAAAHPEMLKALEKFRVTGDPAYLPENPVLYLNALIMTTR